MADKRYQKFCSSEATPQVKIPEDEDNNTGYWKPEGTSYFISGVYRMVTVVNNFSGGDYTTELNLNKLTTIKISMLEKHPPGEET